MKREVSFCSVYLSDLIFSKRLVRLAKNSKTVGDSLLPATENKYKEVLKFIEQRTQQ